MSQPTLEQKIARLKLVADGLRRIQEFESARYLDEYAALLARLTLAEVAVEGSLKPASDAVGQSIQARVLAMFNKGELPGPATAAPGSENAHG